MSPTRKLADVWIGIHPQKAFILLLEVTISFTLLKFGFGQGNSIFEKHTGQL